MSSKKENLIPELERKMDKLCKKHIDEKELLIRTSKIAGMIGKNTERVRRQGFPARWDSDYDSCTWEYREGLVVEPRGFLQEKYPERYGNDEDDEEKQEVEAQ